MYRKQYDQLLNWKQRSNRKPLVIRGARQVGKTYLVREFAEKEPVGRTRYGLGGVAQGDAAGCVG